MENIVIGPILINGKVWVNPCHGMYNFGLTMSQLYIKLMNRLKLEIGFKFNPMTKLVLRYQILSISYFFFNLFTSSAKSATTFVKSKIA